MARTAGASSRTYVPDAAQSAVIAEFVRVLHEAGVNDTPDRPALVSANGERHPLPDAMYQVLRQVAEALDEGMGVSVAPLSAMLTTQEAAEYLGISRPTMVRILERGDIPMHRPGRHRYVMLADLVAYQDRVHAQRQAALEQMITDAESNDLYSATDRPVPPLR